ncbi:MAG: twin-arginine translocase TatA/TatE family subunit [Clostridiales bacterium]|nr:twin-arginine translocase TatA/TatE family subunit [Clostridiales bacterium]
MKELEILGYEYAELMLMRIGTTEIILLLILALLIFGGSKLSGLGKALGTSIRDFKKETSSLDKPEEETIEVTKVEVKKEEAANV